MSQVNRSKQTDEISNLPSYQHEDRRNLYQHLINQCDIKIGLHSQEIARQERLRKHYMLNKEAHQYYLDSQTIKIDARAD